MRSVSWACFVFFRNCAYIDNVKLGVTPSRRPVKESAIIDDVLEEDDSFAYAPTPPRPSALPSRPSAHLAHPHEDSDEELEEDMSFMAPHAHEHHPLTSESVTTHTPALTDDVEDDDMDFAEDPAFTTAAQASTSTQLHPRSAFVTDGDDDDESEGLPSVSQLIRNGAGKRSIDVSNLDLGSRYNQHMLLSGTTYSGKKMRFRRQRGNALVGEVSRSNFCYIHNQADNTAYIHRRRKMMIKIRMSLESLQCRSYQCRYTD